MSRKRLGRVDPAAAAGVREAAEQAARTGAPKGAGLAPIAQVAQGVSREIDAEIHRLRAELNKVAEAASALQTAEEEGRLLKIIPLDEIDLGYIQRDRIHMGRAGEEWAALKASIAARGQQMPIEVADQGIAVTPRYGLISGMRRVLVLQELHRETGEDRHARVTAILRPADMTSTDRLIAMIEENEIRADISFYERGRIASLAASQGIFADADAAVELLFASSHRNRRYKIRCFVTVHEELGKALWYPQALGERLGIQLAKVLRAGQGDRIRTVLEGAGGRDAAGEAEILTHALASVDKPVRAPKPRPVEGVWESDRGQRIVARAQPESRRVTVDLGEDATLSRDTLERLAEWLGREIG